ncbi:MAG: DEAD/DEAH box helicase family protein [Candidatus Moranbacteria bacterium]|nr:DEAD/DEAH box helicase family protein [Candidatus Moranbacteria bacterium]
MPILYEEIKSAFEWVPRPEIPQFLADNLKHDFRAYQREALENFIFYLSNPKYSAIKPKHLLFHMATGSGKTNIIASTILFLYSQGYRNFVFFVNTANIIMKTRENLANPFSQKYLFKEKIIIHNQQIHINEISGTFAESKSDNINIHFTTVQGLHTSLTTLNENGITYDDFKDKKLVLIADEAHHLNANKKKNNTKSSDEDEEKTWGNTVEKLLKTNLDNILLEFTATAGLASETIAHHYQNKTIYDYPLKSFRNDKYSKEIILQSDSFNPCGELTEKHLRILQAVLVSEYRKIVAEKNNIALKPVIMFKNKATKDADSNYAMFRNIVDKLETKHIECLFNRENKPSAIKKLSELKMPYELITSIQREFAHEHCIVIYGTAQDKDNILKNLNNLESSTNLIRAIFAVEILNEGWDVLNLFDIVKLDEAPKTINKTTTKEAQLIGRGARYYPFSYEEDERYTRKYDNDLSHELRILEEMYFHSVNDNAYINILKTELTKTGIADFTTTADAIVTMKVKSSFLNHAFYKSGAILVNKRINKDKSIINGIKDYIKKFGDLNYTWNSIDSTSQINMDNQEVTIQNNVNSINYCISEIDYSAIRSAINKNDFFYFANLKRYFQNLKSIDEFIKSHNYLGNICWTVQTSSKNFKPDFYEQRRMVLSILEKIKNEIIKNNFDYEGTKEFCPISIKERVIDKTIKVKDSSKNGMKGLNPPIWLNANPDQTSWYVYDENYGTSEEMDFVKFFHGQHKILQNKYDDIWLIRNEKAYWIYSFDNNGQRFEPDFILLLKCKSNHCTYQVFIEPKGSQLKLLDKWKEDFLNQLNEATLCLEGEPLLIESECFKIMGLPFYNHQDENYFKEKFETLLEIC